MKKPLLIVIAVIIIAIVGVAGYVVALQLFPNTVDESRDDIPVIVTEQAQPTNETTEPQPTPEQPKEPTGTFVGLGAHQASGRATLISASDGKYIRLEDDFSVTNGPDLYVYVGSDNSQQQQVAVLKGTKGGQNYKLPDGIDPASFDTVWIYCKQFSTPFAKAKLTL